MVTTGDLERASVSPNTTVNGANALYTFSIRASSPLKDGDRIYLKTPTTVTTPVSPTCVGTLELASSLSCNTLNQELYVTLSFTPSSTLDPSKDFEFTVSGFTNPTTTEASSTFTIEAQDSIGSLINAFSGSLTIQTDTPATITTSSITNELQDASAETTFILEFTTIHEIPIGGVVEITYPAEVQPFDNTVSTVLCSVNIATSPTCSHDNTNKKITVSNIVTTTALGAGTSVRVNLNNMKNPSLATGTSSFQIETFTASNKSYSIDKVSSGLTLSVNCDYPCKECDSSDKANCTSCLTSSAGAQLLLQGTTCVESCNKDYVNINNKCEPCNEKCGA
jgi:hypothetical protein